MVLPLLDLLLLLQHDCVFDLDFLLEGFFFGLKSFEGLLSSLDLGFALQQLVVHFSVFGAFIGERLLSGLSLGLGGIE